MQGFPYKDGCARVSLRPTAETDPLISQRDAR
jgi:hypothetical protein